MARDRKCVQSREATRRNYGKCVSRRHRGESAHRDQLWSSPPVGGIHIYTRRLDFTLTTTLPDLTHLISQLLMTDHFPSYDTTRGIRPCGLVSARRICLSLCHMSAVYAQDYLGCTWRKLTIVGDSFGLDRVTCQENWIRRQGPWQEANRRGGAL